MIVHHRIVQSSERSILVFVGDPASPGLDARAARVLRAAFASSSGAACPGGASRSACYEGDERAQAGDAGAYYAHGWFGVGPDGCVDKEPVRIVRSDRIKWDKSSLSGCLHV